MKKFLIVLGSLLPIIILIILSVIDKNSVIKWKIICIEYICILIVCYIRILFFLRKYKKVLALYVNKKYGDIIENYYINVKLHSFVDDLINLIIALAYWNINKDDVFISIMNQIKNKNILYLKQFYYIIYYVEKNKINESKKIYETLNNIKPTNNTYIKIIELIYDKKSVPIDLLDKNVILKNDIRTYNFIVGLSNTEKIYK